MTFTGIHQPSFDPATAYWELQTFDPKKPDCYHLKCKGHPYPHGTLMPAHNGLPGCNFKWTTFACDDMGRQSDRWLGYGETIEEAKAAAIAKATERAEERDNA